jgi:hypothetical protein
MATLSSDLVNKKIRHRGLYVGKEQSLSGSFRIADGASIATTDLMRAVPLGENVRPIRITLLVTPLSGTPVLTNPTFDVGVEPVMATNFKRPDGTEFAPLAADTDILSPDAVIAANSTTDIEIPRPVADSVSGYGPFYVTLTPSGAGAFSVAGGDIQLQVEVVFLGEQNADATVYDAFANTKYEN